MPGPTRTSQNSPPSCWLWCGLVWFSLVSLSFCFILGFFAWLGLALLCFVLWVRDKGEGSKTTQKDQHFKHGYWMCGVFLKIEVHRTFPMLYSMPTPATQTLGCKGLLRSPQSNSGYSPNTYETMRRLIYSFKMFWACTVYQALWRVPCKSCPQSLSADDLPRERRQTVTQHRTESFRQFSALRVRGKRSHSSCQI